MGAVLNWSAQNRPIWLAASLRRRGLSVRPWTFNVHVAAHACSRVPRCPGGEGVDEDHEVIPWRLARSQAPQHAAAVCLRAARHVRIEGDRVVLVRHAGMQVQLDGHACMAERERVTQAFVAEDVEPADLRCTPAASCYSLPGGGSSSVLN